MIKDGRLKFGDKTKFQMKIDSDPLQVADAHYIEFAMVNMVEVSEGHHKNAIMIELGVSIKKPT